MYGGHVPYSTTRVRVVLVENIFGTVRLIEYFLKLRHIYRMRYIVIYLRTLYPEFILHINDRISNEVLFQSFLKL